MPPRSLLAVALAALAFAPALGSGAAPPEEIARLALPAGIGGALTLPLGAPVPADATGIGPGTLLLVDVERSTYVCTAGYLFTSGETVYVGTAGHCLLPDGVEAAHGPGGYDASGVRVRACVASCHSGGATSGFLGGVFVPLGGVAYARQSAAGVQIGNDFGLVRVPEEHLALLRRDIPAWGRPLAAAHDLAAGAPTCHYGHAVGLGESQLTKARAGAAIGLGAGAASWRSAAPAAMGDSGAAVALCRAKAGGLAAERALGILTHVTPTGAAGTTLARAERMALEVGLPVTASL